MSELRRRNVQAEEEPVVQEPTLEKIARVMTKADLFDKVSEDDDIQERTGMGGVVSLVGFLLIGWLFLSAIYEYTTVQVSEHLMVDNSRSQQMEINFDITFPDLQCSISALDLMDASGEQILDSVENSHRQRLDSEGNKIGSEILHMSHEEDPHDEYGEGCRIYGSLHTNKVAGNFHIALGNSKSSRGDKHVHNFKREDLQHFNASHIIHRLSFGDDYPGVVNPMNDVSEYVGEGLSHFKYFLKLVPTTFIDVDGNEVDTCQYSYTRRRVDMPAGQLKQLPGVFFIYEFSPFKVQVEAKQMPFAHFITSTCAIIGGVFTITGLVDSLMYHLFTKRAKKAEMAGTEMQTQ